MTINENKTIAYIDNILRNRKNIDLDYKYYQWQKSKVREIKITSVYTIFTESQLAEMIDISNPRSNMCYDASIKAVFYNPTAIKSVIGYQIVFNDIFINHAINKITIGDNTYYFDLVSELAYKDNVENLNFVALQEFSEEDITHYLDKTHFLDRLLFVWFQQTIFPKKIIRP